jgi:hypothetical protein
MLISNPLKKLLKNAHKKKVIRKTSLTNMSKSEKSPFFRPFFAHNFFNGLEISVKFCIFDTFFDLKKKNLLGHISTFFKL